MGSNNLQDKPVFICGHPKSGTSLVRSILDSHPQLIVYPEETAFFRRFLPLAKGKPFERQITLAEETLIHFFTWNQSNPPPSQAGFPDRDYSYISYESVRDAMIQFLHQDFRDERDFLSAAVMAFGHVRGQSIENSLRWVEKSPYNEFYAQEIFSWWPDARCIHVVRDPRDNFISYQQKHPNWSPEFFTANWKRSSQSGLNNRDKYGSKSVLLIRYEDLVNEPSKRIQEIMAFLGIDWDPSLITPTRAGTQWQGNSMFADQFNGISTAPIGRWKDKLTPVNALVIHYMAQPINEIFQYQPISPKPAFYQTLNARSRVITWSLKKGLSKFVRLNPFTEGD